MPVSFRKKLLFRNCLITIIPCTDDLGVITEVTASEHVLTGRAGRVSLQRRKTMEEVSGNDAENEDYEILKRGFQLTIESIKHIAGAELEDLAHNYDLVHVICQSLRGSAQALKRHYYGIISEDGWDVQTGKNMDSLTILPKDVSGLTTTDTANPAFEFVSAS
jgi:hypothetical protein